jgi:hypothetical protein
MKKINIILPVILITVMGCKAQTGLQTKEVFMYKNGFAYVHKSGTVSLQNSQYTIVEKDIPNMLYGSVWLQSPQNVTGVNRFVDTVEDKLYQPTVAQMIRQSLGKNIKLNISVANGLEQISGKVIKIFETPLSENSRKGANLSIAAIETTSGTVIIDYNTINQVLFATIENAATTEFTEKAIKPGLAVSFGTKNATADLDWVYLERHSSWASSYRLKLNGDKKALLVFNAEVNSGNLEMKNAQLNLVAANPDVFGGGLPSKLNGDYEMYEYDADNYEPSYGSENRAGAKIEESVKNGTAEDYYIYSIKNVTLLKNQSALLNILQEEIDVNHLYLCQLNYNSEYSLPDGFGAPLNLSVFHAIEFSNPSKQPLTSAPVFVETEATTGGLVLLGQPMLPSTPVSGKAQLLISQSLDIPLTQTETEKSRISGDKSIKSGEGYIQFDKIAIEANIHVENQGKKEVNLQLKRDIQGNLLESEVGWVNKLLPPQNGYINAFNTVTWNLKLKPGEKKDFKYTYEYYLRLY